MHESILQCGECIRGSSTPSAAMMAQCRTLCSTTTASIADGRAPHLDVHDLFKQLRALERVHVAVFLVAERDVVELVGLVGRHEGHGLDQLVERLEQDRVVG